MRGVPYFFWHESFHCRDWEGEAPCIDTLSLRHTHPPFVHCMKHCWLLWPTIFPASLFLHHCLHILYQFVSSSLLWVYKISQFATGSHQKAWYGCLVWYKTVKCNECEIFLVSLHLFVMVVWTSPDNTRVKSAFEPSNSQAEDVLYGRKHVFILFTTVKLICES